MISEREWFRAMVLSVRLRRCTADMACDALAANNRAWYDDEQGVTCFNMKRCHGAGLFARSIGSCTSEKIHHLFERLLLVAMNHQVPTRARFDALACKIKEEAVARTTKSIASAVWVRLRSRRAKFESQLAPHDANDFG